MLDLAFVRNNLPLVEEKLRQRGLDPSAVLKDFDAIDARRRSAITEAETMKALRNKLIEEFQRLRKDKLDTAANLQEQKELKDRIADAEKRATDYDAQLRDILTGSARRAGKPQHEAAIEQFAASRGICQVSVRSNVARLESHSFYDRLGYTRVKTQHSYRKNLEI